MKTEPPITRFKLESTNMESTKQVKDDTIEPLPDDRLEGYIILSETDVTTTDKDEIIPKKGIIGLEGNIKLIIQKEDGDILVSETKKIEALEKAEPELIPKK